MKSAILSILLGLPISPRDQLPESFDEHLARMDTVATAIESVANRAACYQQEEPCKPVLADRFLAAAVLLVQGRRESAFRRDIQLGQCREHECDVYNGVHRARGTFQLHRAPTESLEQWQSYAGANLESAAWRTITLWSGGAHRRQGLELHCGFQRLAHGGRICWSDGGKDRAAEAVRVAARLRGGK